MRAWTRTPVAPGDRVTVVVQYSNRPVLRPLSGLLRTVAVTADRRALILDEDGSRYRVNGRVVPPVQLCEVSIFTDNVTGELWAEVYHLPPRDTGPYPLPARYLQVAQPDGRGGISWKLRCWCDRGCVCDTCGDRLIDVSTSSGLDWSTQSLSDDGTHSWRRCGHPSSCPVPEPPDTVDTPDCCAMPMRLAPTAWVCHRESAHRRPYLWPTQAGVETPLSGPESISLGIPDLGPHRRPCPASRRRRRPRPVQHAAPQVVDRYAAS